MVDGNGGEVPVYIGKAKNLHSSRSRSSGQKQLQMQFDAWMNNINIARVPETVSREMDEKGKGNAAANKNTKSSNPIPASHPMQEFASFLKEAQSSKVEESKSAKNYKLGTPQGHVTANFVEGKHYQGTPRQSETSKKKLVDPNIMQTAHPSNMVFNNNVNSNKEGNLEVANGKSNVMTISPPPPVQVPPSPSGVLCDLDKIFPSLDSSGGNVPLAKRIQDAPIWEWDDLYFP